MLTYSTPVHDLRLFVVYIGLWVSESNSVCCLTFIDSHFCVTDRCSRTYETSPEPLNPGRRKYLPRAPDRLLDLPEDLLINF